MGGDALSWACGFLDGEGAFMIHSNGGGVEISAPNTDPRPIYRLRDLFGGAIDYTVAVKDNTRNTFRWRVYGDTAREVAARLLETGELTAKAEQAEIIRDSNRYPRGSYSWQLQRRRIKSEKRQEYNEDGSPRR